MLKRRRNQMRRLVLAYLERLGAAIEDLGNDIFRVEMSREQAAELEGGWMPPSGPWSPHAPAHVTYYFTFTPEVAQAHEEAELIGLGSHRLDQVIRSIRKIGGATRVWLPAPFPANVAYRPFYLFTIELDFVNTTKPREVMRIAVDTVDQIALTQAAELLYDLPLESGYPDRPAGAVIEPAVADFERSFELAYESVLQLLETRDSDWALRAQSAIDEERNRLSEYFAMRERDGDDVSEDRDRRLQELEAIRPGVVARVQGVAEVYLPVLWENGVLRHLAFERPGHLASALSRR